eukprot:TCONS_00043732-protein
MLQTVVILLLSLVGHAVSVAYSKDYLDLMDKTVTKDLKQYYVDGTNFLISLNLLVRKIPAEDIPLFTLEDNGATIFGISITDQKLSYQTKFKKDTLPLSYNQSKPLNIRFKQENGVITVFRNCALIYQESGVKKTDLDFKDYTQRNSFYFHEHINLCHARYYPFINQVGACQPAICEPVSDKNHA